MMMGKGASGGDISSPEKQVVRCAVAADGSACAAILDAWIEETAWMPRKITRAELERILTEGLPQREAYVIGDPVVGYLSMDPAESHIWGFYVGIRGTGLGKALMDQAKTGRQFVSLNTHAANTRAHDFYRREGFVQVGAPWVGDDGIPEIRMEWHA